LAELEYFGIPKVIVPLPSHDQPTNARWYADKHGDIVVNQDNIGEIDNALRFHLDHKKKASPHKEDFFKTHKRVWEALLNNA